MAVIKFTNSKSSIKRILDYITQESKTTTKLIIGKDCMANTSYEEMLAIKNMYHKNSGRQYIHLVQSFAPADKLIKEQAHEIGLKLAEYFKGFQVLVATHIDREHLHNHLLINSVNFENGKKFHQTKEEMQLVKDFSDKICKEYGLDIITEKQNNSIYKQAEYQVALKGESEKLRLTNAIDYAMENSNTKMEFIKTMNSLDYQVKWYENHKYITYTTPWGRKFRDNKLNDKKYLKGEMENAFSKGFEKVKSNTNTRESENTNTIANRDEIQSSTGTGTVFNTGLVKANITKYNRHQIEDERPQDLSRYGDRTEKRVSSRDGEDIEGEFRKITNGGNQSQETKIDISNESNRHSYTCNDSSMHNIIFAVRDLCSILEIFATRPPQPRRAIGGWRNSLSKQAKREYYLKHRTGHSMWQQDYEMDM